MRRFPPIFDRKKTLQRFEDVPAKPRVVLAIDVTIAVSVQLGAVTPLNRQRRDQ